MKSAQRAPLACCKREKDFASGVLRAARIFAFLRSAPGDGVGVGETAAGSKLEGEVVGGAGESGVACVAGGMLSAGAVCSGGEVVSGLRVSVYTPIASTTSPSTVRSKSFPGVGARGGGKAGL